MLSDLRARPAPLLLLTSVLSETLAAKGDHISFVIGPFRPRLGPPSDPEPRGRSLLRAALESVEPATAQLGELGSRVANAAGPRHLLSETSHRARLGWPRPRCAYRPLLAPCALASWGFAQLPQFGPSACTRARAPPFSALPPLPPSPSPLLSVRRLLGLIGIRNPFNLQRSKLTSARVLGGGWGRGHRGGGFRQTGNISPLGTARFCVLPPSSLQPPPFSRPLGR